MHQRLCTCLLLLTGVPVAHINLFGGAWIAGQRQSEADIQLCLYGFVHHVVNSRGAWGRYGMPQGMLLPLCTHHCTSPAHRAPVIHVRPSPWRWAGSGVSGGAGLNR